MAEAVRPGFRVGDCVRYLGEPGGAGDGGAPFLLAPGLVGYVVEGPEARPGPEAPRYRVMFGGTAVWLPPRLLDWE